MIAVARTKTTFTGASIEEYLAARANAGQREDCYALMAMMERITGDPPRMWGPSIVGHGVYRYTYASGHGGEAPVAGFAIRGRDLVVYVSCEGEVQRALLAKLGKHSIGKSCLYFRTLADLDAAVLEQIVAESVADVRRRYG